MDPPQEMLLNPDASVNFSAVLCPSVQTPAAAAP